MQLRCNAIRARPQGKASEPTACVHLRLRVVFHWLDRHPSARHNRVRVFDLDAGFLVGVTSRCGGMPDWVSVIRSWH